MIDLPSRLYMPASALALAGMVWQMGWVSNDLLHFIPYITMGVLFLVLVSGTYIGIMIAFTYVVIALLDALLDPRPAQPVPPVIRNRQQAP